MKTALARLRAKTDHDLGILLTRQLQRSLAASHHRTNYEDAIRVYETSRALLAVAELSPAKRAGLERLLDDLRKRLPRPTAAVA